MPNVTCESLRNQPDVTVEEGHRAASWGDKPINIPGATMPLVRQQLLLGTRTSHQPTAWHRSPGSGSGFSSSAECSPDSATDELRASCSCSTEQRAASPSPRGSAELFVGFKRYLRRRQ